MTGEAPRPFVLPVGHVTPTASCSVASAAARLYSAECALHAARQSGVDSWILAAANRLHEAIEAYEQAMATVAA